MPALTVSAIIITYPHVIRNTETSQNKLSKEDKL